MILRIYELRERLRIWRAQATEKRWWSMQITHWALAQWLVLVYAVVLILVLTYIDTFILSFTTGSVNSSDSTVLTESISTGLRELTTPTLAFGATLFIYLMASWYLVAQSAAGRYESSIILDRLTQDQASGTIANIVATAMLVLLWALIALPLLNVTPTSLVLVPMAMLSLSLLSLLAYRRYCLTLLNPVAIGRRIRVDAQRCIVDVTRRGYSSPSVDNRQRQYVLNDLDVWDGLLAFTSAKDTAAHFEVVTVFAGEIAFYLSEKPRIPIDSEWFPIRRKPIPLGSTSGQREMRHMHEAQGLGASYTKERDRFWFERKSMFILGVAARRNPDNVDVRNHVITAFAALLQYLWERQDIEALVTIERFWTEHK